MTRKGGGGRFAGDVLIGALVLWEIRAYDRVLFWIHVTYLKQKTLKQTLVR